MNITLRFLLEPEWLDADLAYASSLEPFCGTGANLRFICFFLLQW